MQDNFFDESQTQMCSTRRVNVRCPINGRFSNRYVTKTVKFGDLSIMICGVIKGDNTRILIRCLYRLESLKYQNVLDEWLSKFKTVSLYLCKMVRHVTGPGLL